MSNKNSNKKATGKKPDELDVFEPIEETIDTEIENAPKEIEEVVKSIPEPVKTIVGKIIGCQRLRVRIKPNTNAKVKNILPVDTKVVIDNTKSTDEFYFVSAYTDTPLVCSGYCMKQYIEIEK